MFPRSRNRSTKAWSTKAGGVDPVLLHLDVEVLVIDLRQPRRLADVAARLAEAAADVLALESLHHPLLGHTEPLSRKQAVFALRLGRRRGQAAQPVERVGQMARLDRIALRQ